MNLKTLIRNWCPPILFQWARKVGRRDDIAFEGDYPSWSLARRASIGYDSALIFERVRDAALKVKRGEAAFERDSMCFYEEEYRWPSLTCLLALAIRRRGRLGVLDLGGSLGSYYYQHKKFISMLDEVHWSVVEQKEFARCGRDQFQDECLRFYDSLEDCLSGESMDVVFLSGILQYLERPYETLAMLFDARVPYLLIDRTPFIDGTQDKLAVQHVRQFHDSYPAWLFSREKFRRVIEEGGYRPIIKFKDNVDLGISNYQGMFLERV